MSRRTPAELVTALRDWQVPIRPYEPTGRPWYGHNTGRAFNPQGILHHHTAGSRKLLTDQNSRANMLHLLRNGHSALRGPLCHFAPAMDGNKRAVLHLVAFGSANHAGWGDGTNLAAVRSGAYRGRRPSSNAASGNAHLYGFEYLHPGDATTWPDELLEVGHRAAAAICQAHGWTGQAGAQRNLEHHEWTGRKIDRSWRGSVRQAVLAELNRGPNPNTPQEETDMAWTKRVKVWRPDDGSKRGDEASMQAQLQQARGYASGAHFAARAALRETQTLREAMPDIVANAVRAELERREVVR